MPAVNLRLAAVRLLWHSRRNNSSYTLFCFLTLGVPCIAAESPAPSLIENLAKIRSFLTNPPPIALVVIQAANGTAGSLPGAHPDPIAIYRCARQDNNFYGGRIANDEDYLAPIQPKPFDGNFTVGRSGNTIWTATPSYVERTSVSDEDLANFLTPKITNHVYQFASGMAHILFRYLDLGIPDVQHGSYRFNGNQFTVRLNRGVETGGEMLAKEGRVTGIRFQIPGLDKRIVSEFEYGGSSYVPSFLPTHVVQKVFSPKGDFVRISLDFQFIRLELATNRLEDAYFLPDRFYDPDALHSRRPLVSQLTFSNGVSYQQRGGRLIVTPEVQKERRSMPRWVFIIAAGAVIALFPVLLVRLKKQLTH